MFTREYLYPLVLSPIVPFNDAYAGIYSYIEGNKVTPTPDEARDFANNSYREWQ